MALQFLDSKSESERRDTPSMVTPLIIFRKEDNGTDTDFDKTTSYTLRPCMMSNQNKTTN